MPKSALRKIFATAVLAIATTGALAGAQSSAETPSAPVSANPISRQEPFVNGIGDREWWSNGKLHREDGPAAEYANGDKEWYKDGKRHRTDGPAVIWADGSKFWLLNGKLHREKAPAVEYANGDKEWYIEGKLHREDGPAVEYANGRKLWYLNNQPCTTEQFEQHRKDMNAAKASKPPKMRG